MQAKTFTDVRSDVLVLQQRGDIKVPWRQKNLEKDRESQQHVQTTYQLHQALQERNQLFQLVVVSVHEPALDGDPVGKLKNQQQQRALVSRPPSRDAAACVFYLIGEGLR